MKEQFVPYEIALKLKEKGFNENCMYPFVNMMIDTSYVNFIDWNEKYKKHNGLCAAPLWQQVIDWLDKKEIFCSAELSIEDGLFKWNPIIKKVVDYEEFKIKLNPRGTKIHALTDSIEHALTLI